MQGGSKLPDRCRGVLLITPLTDKQLSEMLVYLGCSIHTRIFLLCSRRFQILVFLPCYTVISRQAGVVQVKLKQSLVLNCVELTGAWEWIGWNQNSSC